MLRKHFQNIPHVGWAGIWAGTLLLLSLTIPLLVVDKPTEEDGAFVPWQSFKPPELQDLVQPAHSMKIPIFLSKENEIRELTLPEYVRGVVAAEMPADFRLEALKAQAIAARTYLVNRINNGNLSDVPDGAWITDTVTHQAFVTEDAMRRRWGRNFTKNIAKLNRAVNETEGLIVTYRGEPIEAVYFSTSNGHTENSEEYFSREVPYLRSVPSPWDAKLSPKYEQTKRLSIEEVAKQLKVSAAMPVQGGEGDGRAFMQVLDWTEGRRIASMRVSDRVFTGREVREALDLASSQFDWKMDRDTITFRTYGYGHGVGLSQWGAEGMARQGKTAETILQYYYQGTVLSRIEPFLENF